MGMAGMLVTATITMFVFLQAGSSGVIARAETVQDAQVGLREMDQELRQAYSIQFPTSTTTSTATAGGTTTCTASSGVEPCNVVDFLARLTGTGFSYADYEVRFDCTASSTTVSGDRTCWRYLCAASATTGSTAPSTCTSSSSNLLTDGPVIDDLTNATSTSPVFSFCYPNTGTTGSSCTAGAAQPTSATVTIDVPSSGQLKSAQNGDPSTIQLTDGVYMPNLNFGQ